MHIEKNFFDNLFNTMMDVSNKTKDNLKARMDLKEYCRGSELYLTYLNNKIQKSKASYTFTLDDRRVICDWVKNLRMPDGYASNLSRCVDMKEGKLTSMKSQSLMPIAFSTLPDRIWKPITEISLFFKDLYSNTLREENLSLMDINIRLTLNKLAKIFPPVFFLDVMEHFPIHLVREAQLGGPVQCRWMYLFERIIGKGKRTIKNRSRIEGSIYEAYLAKETSYFCSYYFENDVPCLRNRPNRHDDGDNTDFSAPPFSIFNQTGKGSPKVGPLGYLNEVELKSATTHVLLNCPEVLPFYNYFVALHGDAAVYPMFSV
ncbi:uncharacterized protein LOC107863406 [Capsicum annuum]|uniref:uncharacterized protein LOC107863406 n=1 Tax=Capsicum annuum TaxID=4072 RepID=UPI001FB0D606|nr:uncharacterized protein LOC107863406 [Capsicum annuum]XP_047264522.1 uncharacterized protein LOC107863406 [Capsicum annuum]XP_047264523.1 uncharacterized protein LOC107863406 [Capsicum annuum]